ncbi:LysR substrate-binding domain-containing protein [Conyzicola nivalis]|uniref:LysR family transcriptional regulator n=1 Tax=Conyzicola nivalis TaxID=1477021 RepID=A0A916SFR6_9MICO|nr:LysR family transcriptional regulator [Conyzicola nivalis]GGA98019.1 LysR family transcriptional regulator [Conyzicola nivalis]
MYSLEQVRGFVAVAEELHFGRAADRLQMTQPPLSRQIQKLERSIGVSLLDRNNRSVSLTPAGLAFLAEARRLLIIADTAPESARRIAEGVAGRLSIGFTAMTAVGVLPHVLAEADSFLPGVDIVLNELVSDAQFEALLAGDLDLALVRLPPHHPEFDSRLVARETLVAAVPADHPLGSTTAPVSAREFEGLDMIMYTSTGASYFADLVASVLVNVRPRSTQRLTQVHSMMSLVGAGRGAAIVPESAGTFHIDGVVLRPIIEWDRPVVELRAVWRRDSSNAAMKGALARFSTLQPLSD